jgi:hypothetical protein
MKEGINVANKQRSCTPEQLMWLWGVRRVKGPVNCGADNVWEACINYRVRLSYARENGSIKLGESRDHL